MPMENFARGLDIKDEVNEKEAQLKKAKEMREKIVANSALVFTAEREQFLEKIDAAERQLNDEVVKLYAELKEIDPTEYRAERSRISKESIEKTKDQQEAEGRGYKDIERACDNAWNKILAIVGSVGISAAALSEVMAFVSMPPLNGNMSPVEYIEAQRQSAEWILATLGSGTLMGVGLMIGYAFVKLNEKLKTKARWDEIMAVRDAAWAQRGM